MLNLFIFHTHTKKKKKKKKKKKRCNNNIITTAVFKCLQETALIVSYAGSREINQVLY